MCSFDKGKAWQFVSSHIRFSLISASSREPSRGISRRSCDRPAHLSSGDSASSMKLCLKWTNGSFGADFGLQASLITQYTQSYGQKKSENCSLNYTGKTQLFNETEFLSTRKMNVHIVCPRMEKYLEQERFNTNFTCTYVHKYRWTFFHTSTIASATRVPEKKSHFHKFIYLL